MQSTIDQAEPVAGIVTDLNALKERTRAQHRRTDQKQQGQRPGCSPTEPCEITTIVEKIRGLHNRVIFYCDR